MSSFWTRFMHRAKDLTRFIRLPAYGLTVLLPLLGAASDSSSPRPDQVIGIALVALAFHCYAYVLNDVVDLPVDRTHPARRVEPLARGAISRQSGLLFAVAQIPVMVALTVWLGGTIWSVCALGCALALVGAYDVWGKVIPVAFVADGIQALGWLALVLYGATLVSGAPRLVPLLTVSVVSILAVLLINVTNGLKDIGNDRAHGRCTTPVLLGARVGTEGLVAPPALVATVWGLQLALSCATLVPLVGGAMGYGGEGQVVALAGSLTFNLIASLLVAAIFAHLRVAEQTRAVCDLHIIVLLVPLVILFAPLLAGEPRVLLPVILLFVVPLGGAVPSVLSRYRLAGRRPQTQSAGAGLRANWVDGVVCWPDLLRRTGWLPSELTLRRRSAPNSLDADGGRSDDPLV